jgi:3-oxoacyl-(acyl-carrier-protein) synthase
MPSSPPVAITGVGAITALGAGVDETFRGILAGQRGMRPIRRFDSTGCRVRIAAEAPEPRPATNAAASPLGATRTALLGLHAARDALTDAGYPAGAPAGTALVLGSAGAGDATLETHLQRMRRGAARSATLARYPKRAATDFVAAALELDGPRATINTACSSSLVAIIHAVELLRSGLCSVALAGGADELTRYTLSGFCSLRAVDPEPCRPFDVARRGMSLGEGAGFVVLEDLARATQRGATVLAVVAGYGHSCDAGHLTAPDASGAGAARAIRAALAMARIAPREVGFVNAHGTGTPHNDGAELAALSLALGPSLVDCPLHSAKANLGHCMGAAGAIEAIVTLRSLRAGIVPHTPGLERPEQPDLADFVLGTPRPIAARQALTNSFGFGGNDAALVLALPEGGQ